MIAHGVPLFPLFRPAIRSDEDVVNRYNDRFSAYSDFNFTNLYSWNVGREVLISELNGNLVYRFADYQSGEPFYMFMGDCDVNNTAIALLDLQDTNAAELRLIPECTARLLDDRLFTIEELPEHADYIERVDELCKLAGRHFASRRHQAARFMRAYPSAIFDVLDLADPRLRHEVVQLYKAWTRGALGEHAAELAAFERCVEFFRDRTVMTALRVDGDIVGITLHEPIGKQMAINHFEKTMIGSYVGVSAYLVWRTAQFLSERGIRFINIEQDLGIPGLRTNKRSYAPVDRLRKYRVRAR